VGESGISGGEVADSGELPVGDDKSGVLFVWRGLVLAVGAAFAADGAKGGGIAAALGREMPSRRLHRTRAVVPLACHNRGSATVIWGHS
jgi:hypothetical protein